jgi:hypothetical protein
MPIPRTKTVDAASIAAARATDRAALPAEAEKVERFEDFPCRHRGAVSLKTVRICATCEKEIELAMCANYATICTVKGSAINGTKSASCADCPQRSQ